MSESESPLTKPIKSVTLHLALDGTRIGSESSRLFRRFDRIAPRRIWRARILKAFRVWGSILGVKVKLGKVARDNFGQTSSSNQDGHVDVNIGARKLSKSMTGLSFGAQDLLAGNWAGSMVFNANAKYKTARDIYSVALHEAGHICGLPHNAHVESIMNPNGNANAIISPRDRKTLRSLVSHYRVRRRDLSSIKEIRGKWAKAQSYSDLRAINNRFGVTLQRKFTVSREVESRLFRIPGANLKFEDPTLTISLEQLGNSSAGNSLMRIIDEDGELVEFVTVNRQSNRLTIQTEDIDPRKSYFVSIDPAEASGVHRFALTAEYGSGEIELNRVFRGRLKDEDDREFHKLNVRSSRLLNLGIRASEGRDGQSVYMVLRNGRGRIIETFAVTTNEINDARTVWLNRGRYSLEVLTAGDRADKKVRYEVLADDPTRPGGPGLVDPTLKPLGQTPGIPGLDLTLNDRPTVLTVDTSVSTLWHDPSTSGTLRWLGLGGTSGLMSSF